MGVWLDQLRIMQTGIWADLGLNSKTYDIPLYNRMTIGESGYNDASLVSKNLVFKEQSCSKRRTK